MDNYVSSSWKKWPYIQGNMWHPAVQSIPHVLNNQVLQECPLSGLHMSSYRDLATTVGPLVGRSGHCHGWLRCLAVAAAGTWMGRAGHMDWLQLLWMHWWSGLAPDMERLNCSWNRHLWAGLTPPTLGRESLQRGTDPSEGCPSALEGQVLLWRGLLWSVLARVGGLDKDDLQGNPGPGWTVLL